MKAINYSVILSGLLCLALVGCDHSPLFECETAIHDETISSDGQLKAGIVDAQCGATTENSSWVVLTKKDNKFDYKQDTVATFEGEITGIKWDKNVLVISYGTTKPFLMMRKAKGSTLIYQH